MEYNYPTAKDYIQYDLVQHVYEKSDTYIGADVPVQREEWVYNIEDEKMVFKTTMIIPGIERIFLEILSNAEDNCLRSYRKGVDPEKIQIDIGQKTITVKNYGLPIPVEKNNSGIYVPALIFGTLLTGSNLSGERIEGGTNGIGAKATNIYSTSFSVFIHDHVNKLSYHQTWNKNMSEIGEAIIKPYNGKFSSTEVSYDMDFKRFKLPEPIDNKNKETGYPSDYISLFYKHALDASFLCKVPVYINEKEYNLVNSKDYIGIYFDSSVIQTGIYGSFITQEYEEKFRYKKHAALFPSVEYIILDTPEEGRAISFANGISTKEGGVHVQATYKAIGDILLPVVNDAITKKLTKIMKVKELDAKTKRLNLASLSNIKEHVSILVSVRVINPKFPGQAKLSLDAPTPVIKLNDTLVKEVKHWNLMNRLLATIEAKQQNILKKADGKLKTHVNLEGVFDANFAGTARRGECSALFTEGKSALSYATKFINLHKNGKDFFGSFPLRGKLLNVTDKDDVQIRDNKEYTALKELLGLKENVDYSSDAAYNTLRYGKEIIIMADSDVDGSHIVSLFINFFHCRFKSLLERGYVKYYKTPIIRVSKRSETIKFYSLKDYDNWELNIKNVKEWTHKYYKGLGTSSNADVTEDFNNQKVIQLDYDKQATKCLELAFHKDFADKRKEWIGKYNTNHSTGYHGCDKENISDYINNELILYSIANISRSIPKITDGFKESHRKVIYSAYNKWNPSETKRLSDYAEYKVARFAMYAAEKTVYQHGEHALEDVIIKMGQDFTGSNNIPWFTQDGQFGSRYFGGTDASNGRYPNTRPDLLFSYILKKDDIPILNYLKDEGESIEPNTYYPIIPMVLVNGANGIATGYSTMIPSHNPIDIINWYLKRLYINEGEEMTDSIIPWYRGYTGKIQVFDRRKTKKKKKNSQEEEESDRQLLSMITTGDFYIKKDGTIIVTELPIGLWPYKYKEWLETLIEKKQISKYRDLSEDNVYFELHNYKGNHSYKSLKLEKTYGMSNMILLDENNHPIRFDSTDDILESFYCRRLPIYEKRKEYQLKKIKTEIDALEQKISFMKAVKEKNIDLFDTEENIAKIVQELNLPITIYKNFKISSLHSVAFNTSINDLEGMKKEYKVLQETHIKTLWEKDLLLLKKEYNKIYK